MDFRPRNIIDHMANEADKPLFYKIHEKHCLYELLRTRKAYNHVKPK